jgi:outer membrane lipoprotein-sorting protein
VKLASQVSERGYSSSRLLVLLAFACLTIIPCHAQASWRWLIVAGGNPASEHLCWVPQNSSALIVVPGKEEDCWSRIIRSRNLEVDDYRSDGIKELCLIAARTLGKPSEQCAVPKVDSVFASRGPTDAVARQPVDAEAERILKKIGETYKGVSQYEFFADQTLTPSGKDATATIHMPMHVAFKAPDKYRLEGAIPVGALGLDHNDADIPEVVVMVHDGSALWFYLPRSNLYYSIPADALAADREGSAHTPAATDGIFMQKYRDAADFLDGAKFLREEEIEIAGTKTGCYVVLVPQKAYTWWVDKKTFRVLRETSPYGDTDFNVIKLNESLPDSLFTFSPPAGAQKLEAKDF